MWERNNFYKKKKSKVTVSVLWWL